MTEFSTLLDALEHNRSSDRTITYIEGERDEQSLSFAELHERALGILHHLQQRHGMRQGDQLIILTGSNEQFIDLFWACLFGGIVPVPVAPGISDEHRFKLFRIFRLLERPHLFTDHRYLNRLTVFAREQELQTEFEAMSRRTVTVENITDISRAGTVADVKPDDAAFIQFSSGSTSEPKGVVLTHRNILANIDGINAAAQMDERDTTLSWMPLTHDMGLIGFHLNFLVLNCHQRLMPTELFVRRPLLWLLKASETRASISCSPNFGYHHVLRVFDAKGLPEGTDLSALRLIFNGAEPISPAVCRRFLQAMQPYGLRSTAIFPVYGLAEASLAVSFARPGEPLRTRYVHRSQLAPGERCRWVEADNPQAVALVNVGRAIPHTELRIGDEEGRALPPEHVGRILIRGDNVTRGYYRAPEVTRATIDADGWLDTGDLGLVAEGDLFITGRRKEIIFVNGQNFYPQDLEHLLQQSEALEPGKVVCTSARRRGEEEEALLVFVQHRGDLDSFMPTAGRVSRRLSEDLGLSADHVMPLNRIPKTTSGKLQRAGLARAYANGEFDELLDEIVRLKEKSTSVPADRLTEMESTLMAICAAVLVDKPVGLHDDLFELGASSLALAEIFERISETYGAPLEITDLFDHPTVSELARHLAKLTEEAEKVSEP